MNKSFGYTDSLAAPTSYFVDSMPNTKDDYAIKSQLANEVVLVNTTTPADQVETVRFAITDIANVYNAAEISPTLQSAVKRGKSFVVGLNSTIRVTGDDGIITDYPVQSHIVVKFPLSANISAEDLRRQVLRNLAFLFEGGNYDDDPLYEAVEGGSYNKVYDYQNDNTFPDDATEGINTRINELMRGALAPRRTDADHI